MAKLTIQTGDGQIVPGQESAKRQQDEQRRKAEQQADSLFAAPAKGQDAGPDYTYSKIRFRKSDEVNIYAQQQDERLGVDPKAGKLVLLAIVLIVAFIFACILPTEVFSLERIDRSIGSLASETAAQFMGLISTITFHDSMYSTYFFEILVALLAGAALGLSGGVYQGALKNALAAPSTLGVTSGGTLGMIIYVLWVYPLTTGDYVGSVADFNATVADMDLVSYIAQYFGSFLCALLGCMIIVALVMIMALIAGRGRVSNVSLVIAGQVFTQVIMVIINWVIYYLRTRGDSDTVELLQTMTTLSFNGVYTMWTVLVFAVPLIVCMIIVFSMSGKLTLLAFKDEEARSMGISTTRTRNTMVALCTILTALVISFAGPIGFVGFMVPHIARNYIGPDFKYLLPACALMGAIMVVVVHYVTTLGIPGIATGSTGTFTSIIGCVMFIVMALRQRGSHNGDWY